MALNRQLSRGLLQWIRSLKATVTGLPRPPRPHPLVLLSLTLGVLAGAVALERSMSQRHTALIEARTAYLGALATTRTELNGLLARAATDKTLAQNLNWRLSHSVQSALTARLQKGSLDQVTLVDDGCREVARARVGRSPSLPCPFAANGEGRQNRTDSFYWIEGETAPVLALVRQVNGVSGSEVYAVGAVALDADWVAQSPKLSDAFRALDLVLGKPKADSGDVVLLAEGKVGKEAPVAALISRGSWDDWLLSDGLVASLPGAFIGPCLVLAFLLAGWSLLKEKAARRRETDRHGDLVAWARTLSPGSAIDLPGKRRLEATPETIQRYVTAALKLRDGELRVVSRRLAAAEDELKTKDQEIKRLKHRLAELAELDSLAVQLARTTKAFLARMEAFRDDAQDLGDMTGDGLAPCARLLVETLGGWRDGIEERGPRKFLRGLSETPAGGMIDKTRLDEDLALLLTLASELDDQALQATMRSRGLVEVADFAVKLAGLWHGIAQKTHEGKVATSLAGPMEEAQALVRLETPGVDFLNAVDPAEIREIPSLPRTVWVTALYHVYLAMAELGRGVGAQIVTRVRKDDDKIMLIVQAAARDGKPLPRRGDQEAYHLDVSRSILAPFPVNITALPSLEGPFPVAVGWQREALDKPTKRAARAGAEARV